MVLANHARMNPLHFHLLQISFKILRFLQLHTEKCCMEGKKPIFGFPATGEIKENNMQIKKSRNLNC